MKKTMDIKDFTYLLLATLANKSRVINLIDKDVKFVSLPGAYKEVIEKVMYQGNGWEDEFSCLINTDEYFYDHYEWEDKFSRCLRETLKELGKKAEYDVVYDCVEIPFKQEEIDKILEKYVDKEINEAMDHFANLLKDTVFTRRYLALQKQFENAKKSVNKVLKK